MTDELDTRGVEPGQRYERVGWYAKSAFTPERVGDMIEVEEIVPYTLPVNAAQGFARVAHARCRYLSGTREGDGIQIACRSIADNWRLVE